MISGGDRDKRRPPDLPIFGRGKADNIVGQRPRRRAGQRQERRPLDDRRRARQRGGKPRLSVIWRTAVIATFDVAQYPRRADPRAVLERRGALLSRAVAVLVNQLLQLRGNRVIANVAQCLGRCPPLPRIRVGRVNQPDERPCGFCLSLAAQKNGRVRDDGAIGTSGRLAHSAKRARSSVCAARNSSMPGCRQRCGSIRGTCGRRLEAVADWPASLLRRFAAAYARLPSDRTHRPELLLNTDQPAERTYPRAPCRDHPAAEPIFRLAFAPGNRTQSAKDGSRLRRPPTPRRSRGVVDRGVIVQRHSLVQIPLLQSTVPGSAWERTTGDAPPRAFTTDFTYRRRSLPLAPAPCRGCPTDPPRWAPPCQPRPALRRQEPTCRDSPQGPLPRPRSAA